jgi:hypothetical protein
VTLSQRSSSPQARTVDNYAALVEAYNEYSNSPQNDLCSFLARRWMLRYIQVQSIKILPLVIGAVR